MPRIINLGSLCTDYVYGVPNITSAGVTIASLDRQVFPGGKGLNQSIAIARAGGEVHHFGAVGPDGSALIETLTREEVDASGVLELDGASGHAFIQVDSEGRNAIVIFGGTNRTIPGELFHRALDRADPGDWLLLQNETNDVDEAIRMAHERNVAVALNLAPADARIHTYPIDLVDLLIVNEDEGEALTGTKDPEAALEKMSNTYPNTSVVLTMGVGGLICRADGAETRLGTFTVEAVDETAAGDAFVGYLIESIVGGVPLHDALVRASAAGALAVTQPGAAPSIPTNTQVAQFLDTNQIG